MRLKRDSTFTFTTTKRGNPPTTEAKHIWPNADNLFSVIEYSTGALLCSQYVAIRLG